MNEEFDLKKINDKIQQMKNTATEIENMCENFPAVMRNIKRLHASVKMLELNVSDLVE